jgi:hypothetical protein
VIRNVSSNVNWTVRKQVHCVWSVMAHAQKPDFVFRRNGRGHLNRRGRQFNRLLAAEVCASALVVGSNAGYTMFRGSAKGTGYPLKSPVSPSLPLLCVTLCRHIWTGVYNWRRVAGWWLVVWWMEQLSLFSKNILPTCFFILHYDQQIHNYFTNYHTPVFRHCRVILRELVINTLPITWQGIDYYDQQIHNYFTNYHTPMCFDTVVSSSGSL